MSFSGCPAASRVDTVATPRQGVLGGGSGYTERVSRTLHRAQELPGTGAGRYGRLGGYGNTKHKEGRREGTCFKKNRTDPLCAGGRGWGEVPEGVWTRGVPTAEHPGPACTVHGALPAVF